MYDDGIPAGFLLGGIMGKQAKHGNCTHGHSVNGVRTKTYKTWLSIHERCNNPNVHNYNNYGGRGIKVCERWDNFKNFLEDMGKKPQGLTIERINNDFGYGPENCKWATIREQNRNNRNVRFKPLEIQIIKKLLKESKLKQWEIGEIFDVKQGVISQIKTGETWADIKYP